MTATQTPAVALIPGAAAGTPLADEITAVLDAAGHTPADPGVDGYQLYGHRVDADHVAITHERDGILSGLHPAVSRRTFYAWERDLVAAGYAVRVRSRDSIPTALIVARDDTVADRDLAGMQARTQAGGAA